MRTRVVNLHVEKPEGYVYIGRGSRWGNEFSRLARSRASVRVATREEALERHKRKLWQDIRDGAVALEDLAALDGKVLGCFCHPASCHGDTLAAAAAWAKVKLHQRAVAS